MNVLNIGKKMNGLPTKMDTIFYWNHSPHLSFFFAVFDEKMLQIGYYFLSESVGEAENENISKGHLKSNSFDTPNSNKR